MMQSRLPYVLTFLITVATGVALLAMGRAGVCPCGYVDLWGTVGTEEANQQVLDWYAPSHLLHGLLFYAALWLVVPRMAIGWRLVIATVVECGWEIVENTDAMIQRYRDTTVSADYVGDSVLNAVSDVVAMWVWFALARFVPVWVSVLVVIGFEVLTAIVIRDGLALNILMLLWPLEAVKEWQGG